jgi:biopolymer transport protein TolR
MAMGGGNKRGEVQSDLNVTPLIDVCLVLLIIFMVITPMLQKGMAVQLPKTDLPGKKPDNDNQLLISIDNNLKIFVDQNWFPDKDFEVKMQEVHERTPGKEIILKGDRTISYGEVLKIMRVCHSVGFSGVGLITEKIEKEGS